MSNAAMENVRWIADWNRQDLGASYRPREPRKIGSVGIIGAGAMGTAIAAAHAQYRLPVVIHDADGQTLGGALAAIAAELRSVDSHLPPKSFSRLVRSTADLAEAARCDLVLESIVETLSAKLQLYRQLQKHLGPHTIVASNTSTIPIGRLSQGLADASRLCGMHFCRPLWQRPLVEIVCGPQTSDHTIAPVVSLARRIGRMPIVVQDGPGFVVNRLLFPYLGEALALLGEGVLPESIERAAAEFGMAVGPLQLMDEIGLDTVLQAAWVLAAAFPERIVSSPLLVSMVKAGRLGRKTGAGFFSYAEQKNDDVLVRTSSTSRHSPTPPHCNGGALGSENPLQTQLAYRLILPMLLEATRILEEGKVRDARDIDLAILFGLGFPAEKGGLLWWADSLGAEHIITLLHSLEVMGPRAQATPMLQTLAKTNGRFYGS
jgi:3-hydroxyacyl-CoA dehydrogenase